ncbi:MAG: SH3 domain-containing protein [Peptostreptococcaceae bacterium]|nr:SH3 domain-containing protein [Peptostreptococcaceae bacterium]
MKKTICLLLLITIMTVGCSSKTPAADTENSGDATPEQIEDEYLGNATIVAMNVSLRESPDASSKKIGSLDFPSEAYLLEKSGASEKIGAYDDYWYKIRVGDLSGWCYGAFISQDDELEQALSEHISDLLPVDKSTTVAKSVSTLKSIVSMTEASDLINAGVMRVKELQENLLPELEGEMLPITETLYGYTVEDLRQPANLPDGAIQNLMKKYRDMGYSVYMAEGMYYIEPDPQFLLGNFKTNISDDLFDYLTYRAEEVESHTFHDAAVIITWNELGDRIVDWENFLSKYPDSPYRDDAKSMYDVYLYTFLIGADNTPAYEYPTEILDPKLLESYRRYILEFPQSSFTPVLGELLVVLEEESYQKTERVMEFINPYNPWN